MEALPLKGVFVALMELEMIDKSPKYLHLKASMHNSCPALAVKLRERYGGFIAFLEGRPEFRLTKTDIFVNKLMSSADQLALLILADIARDENEFLVCFSVVSLLFVVFSIFCTFFKVIQHNVEEVASPHLLQWLHRLFKNGVVSFCGSRPDLFTIQGYFLAVVERF
jgi:hypothetical protein